MLHRQRPSSTSTSTSSPTWHSHKLSPVTAHRKQLNLESNIVCLEAGGSQRLQSPACAALTCIQDGHSATVSSVSDEMQMRQMRERKGTNATCTRVPSTVPLQSLQAYSVRTQCPFGAAGPKLVAPTFKARPFKAPSSTPNPPPSLVPRRRPAKPPDRRSPMPAFCLSPDRSI